MLVLSRKQSEAITIGDDVTIYVRSINGNRVTLGVQAPPEITVLRSEVYQKRDLDNGTGRSTVPKISSGAGQVSGSNTTPTA